MQQPRQGTDSNPSISHDTVQVPNPISNLKSTLSSHSLESSHSAAPENSGSVTYPPMSWHSEAASAYHETIGRKIAAYPVLYQLSGMILEAGMNRAQDHITGASIGQSTEHAINKSTSSDMKTIAAIDDSIHSSINDSIRKANPLSTPKQTESSSAFQPLRHIAVIGAGGGQELVTWLPSYPHWLVTGVDPSVQMLDTARQRAEQADVHTRCQLHIGTIDQLPERADHLEKEPIQVVHRMEGDSLSDESAAIAAISQYDLKFDPKHNSEYHPASRKEHQPLRYDAAACLLVLHFLPHEQQQELLNKLVATVKPGSPVIMACIAVTAQTSANDWHIQVWQKHMQHNGVTTAEWERFAQSIGVTSHPPCAEKMESMLAQAGLVEISTYFQTLSVRAWCGRRAIEGEKVD